MPETPPRRTLAESWRPDRLLVARMLRAHTPLAWLLLPSDRGRRSRSTGGRSMAQGYPPYSRRLALHRARRGRVRYGGARWAWSLALVMSALTVVTVLLATSQAKRVTANSLASFTQPVLATGPIGLPAGAPLDIGLSQTA